MKKGSIKNTRINSEVRKEMASIISNGIKDPRISPMTSVTDAKVTPDLKYCTVYISVLGGEKAEQETMEGLKNAVGFIRRELAHTVNLRITPEIRFVLDKSMEYGEHIDRLINQLNAAEPEDRKAAAEEAPEQEETEQAADQEAGKDEQDS